MLVTKLYFLITSTLLYMIYIDQLLVILGKIINIILCFSKTPIKRIFRGKFDELMFYFAASWKGELAEGYVCT